MNCFFYFCKKKCLWGFGVNCIKLVDCFGYVEIFIIFNVWSFVLFLYTNYTSTKLLKTFLKVLPKLCRFSPGLSFREPPLPWHVSINLIIITFFFFLFVRRHTFLRRLHSILWSWNFSQTLIFCLGISPLAYCPPAKFSLKPVSTWPLR